MQNESFCQHSRDRSMVSADSNGPILIGHSLTTTLYYTDLCMTLVGIEIKENVSQHTHIMNFYKWREMDLIRPSWPLHFDQPNLFREATLDCLKFCTGIRTRMGTGVRIE